MDSNRRPLRVGLIGLGRMGRHHLRAASLSGMTTIVGIADPVATGDELAIAIPGDALVVRSAEELLEKARPDLVHIVTPPSSHATLALQALDAGCHVYVEKPFTPTVEEAARVLEEATRRGLSVCAGHQVLFELPAISARQALPEIGRLTHVESYFSFKTVRRTITPVDQLKDILPHAVYPIVDQLRLGTGLEEDAITLEGVSVDASGEAFALMRLGSARAVLIVTLNGRPVEHYQTIVGTNGSLRADYIGGFLDKLIGPGTGPGVLLTPYRRSWHTLTGTTRGITRLVAGGSYPGLRTLVRTFYESVRDRRPSPVSPRSILDTVSLCESIGTALTQDEVEQEARATVRLEEMARSLPAVRAPVQTVLLTGGTGLLGRRVAAELRSAGCHVRVIARRMPPPSRRIAGVEYVPGDLAAGIDEQLLQGVSVVVHAAAETSGGKSEHRRNSIEATRLLIEAAARAGVKRFVHVSSLAVLKTSRETGGPLDESTPVSPDSIRRGPYVWGKAESELLVRQLGRELGVDVRVIRPGPLVDFEAFEPPGRLGRELGPMFVAIGPRHSHLSVLDVSTAARVVRYYVSQFDVSPPVLNLVEAPPPRRVQLIQRYRQRRPDLRVLWFPAWALRALSGPLKLVQRYGLGSAEPVDVAAAFASEPYRTDLAAQVILRAEQRTASSSS